MLDQFLSWICLVREHLCYSQEHLLQQWGTNHFGRHATYWSFNPLCVSLWFLSPAWSVVLFPVPCRILPTWPFTLFFVPLSVLPSWSVALLSSSCHISPYVPCSPYPSLPHVTHTVCPPLVACVPWIGLPLYVSSNLENEKARIGGNITIKCLQANPSNLIFIQTITLLNCTGIFIGFHVAAQENTPLNNLHWKLVWFYFWMSLKQEIHSYNLRHFEAKCLSVTLQVSAKLTIKNSLGNKSLWNWGLHRCPLHLLMLLFYSQLGT